MASAGYVACLTTSKVDGPTLTAAAAATCIPTQNKITLPAGFFFPGKKIIVRGSGRISNVVTTPGTARLDVRVGAVVAFDGLAINLNVVAKANVAFEFEIELTCRAEGSGTSANLFGKGRFVSEAVIGSPLPTVGGSGEILLPVATAPAVGTGFDSTVAQTLDLFFTQTVATGSFTLHQYDVLELN